MIGFEEYAALRGYGGGLTFEEESATGSYLFDLQMMFNLAKGIEGVVAYDPSGKALVVRAGITLQDEINGLAERVFDQHYCSVTYGHCAALFLASEKLLLSTKTFPDLGNVPGIRLDGRFRVTPDPAAISDPALLIQALEDQQFEDAYRSSLAAYLRHMMFSFVLFHEYAHCTLGHCIHKHRTGGQAFLREVGMSATGTDDVGMHHAFEFMADSHAATYVVRAIYGGLDLPTRIGLIDATHFDKLRIAMLGIAVIISMWFSLETEGVSLHPAPERRLLHIYDDVSWALRGCGLDEGQIERALVQATGDLKEAATWSDDIGGALAKFVKLDYFADLKASIAAENVYGTFKAGQFLTRP